MNDSMRTGMAEATRLTRAGQIIEATALIRRTLRGMRAPEASSDATGEPIDATFRVVDAAPLAMEVSAQGPDQQTRTSAGATPPLPEVAVPPYKRGRASVDLAYTQAQV